MYECKIKYTIECDCYSYTLRAPIHWKKLLILSTALAALPLAIRKIKLGPHQISVF